MSNTYTVAECQERIKEINELIKTIQERPAGSGADGVYSNWQGRLADLYKDRAYWLAECKKAQNAANNGGRGTLGQGPKINMV